jgi:ABC-type transport system involved in multi-copper enzyme maturation permease subunit
MLSRDFPYRLGGPVLAWELTRASRQRWPRLLALSFILFCTLQLTFSYTRFSRQRTEVLRNNRATLGPRAGQLLDIENNARLLFAAQQLPAFFKTQLLWLLLITPAVTAGALGHEKERDTLTALFGTQLSDREIVAGKAAGRLVVLLWFMLLGAPLPCLLAGFAMVPIGPVLLCYLQAAVLTFAMAGICILCSILTRRTRDAVLACYSSLVIITLVSLAVLGEDPLPTWMNPVEILVRVATPPFFSLNAETYLLHLAGFALLGVMALVLSRRLLRWSSLRLLETRFLGWRWRRDLGNDPIRWRERSVLGIAPVQTLRTIPSWLGWAGAFACSFMFVLATINMQTHGLLLQHTLRGDWALVWYRLQRLRTESIPGETAVMGVILCLLSSLTVLIRCTGAVSEEKRRKTWDDLVMTGCRVNDMLQSKRKGILDASWPYLFLYALPIFGYSLFAGWSGVLAALIPCFFAVLLVFAASFLGLALSYSSASSQLGASRKHAPPVVKAFDIKTRGAVRP